MANSADDGLNIEVSRDDGDFIVTVTGEIDMSTAPRLAEVLAPIGANQRVVIDMSGVAFLDSSGVIVVLREAHRHAAEGGVLWVSTPSLPVLTVLEIAGLAHLIQG